MIDLTKHYRINLRKKTDFKPVQPVTHNTTIDLSKKQG